MMSFDIPNPSVAPFQRACVTQGITIDIPDCDMPAVPTPGRVIPAGRPTPPVLPPPPICMQPCPVPFSYEVVGTNAIRLRMDGLIDPYTYVPWDTSKRVATALDAGAVIPTVVLPIAPDAVTFIYLVYDHGAKAPIKNDNDGRATVGMFHISASIPTNYTSPAYSVLHLHRIDTRGERDASGELVHANMLDAVLRCPPGIQNPPYATTISAPATTISAPASDSKHPFKLSPVAGDCQVAVWPGIVMDTRGTTYEPTLDGQKLSPAVPYATAEIEESTSFWLKVRYTTDEETESVKDVTIVREMYDANMVSSYDTLHVLIGKVLHGGVDENTGNCVITPWNSLAASIAVSKCDDRYTITPLGRTS